MAEALLSLARRVRNTFGPPGLWNAIRPIYWRVVAAMASDRGVSLSFPDGHAYRMSPRFYSWQVDKYEPDVVRELCRTLTETSVFYDVGAHVGIITLMAARRVSRGRVYAFEPSPANFDLLDRHTRINGFGDRVVTDRVLLGEQGIAAVPFVHRRDQFTANSLAYAIDGGVTTMTAMTTIDEIVASAGRLPPTHIKIDVEGYETSVLRGASVTLRTYRPWVICAVHPEPLRLLGETPAGLVRFCRDHGYEAFNLSGDIVETPGFEEVVLVPVN